MTDKSGSYGLASASALVQSIAGMDLNRKDQKRKPRGRTDLTPSPHSSPRKSRSRSASPSRFGPLDVVDGLKDFIFRRRPSMPLHNPKSVDALIKELQKPDADANATTDDHDAPIHSIVKTKSSNKREKLELLVALLTYSDADIDKQAQDGMTSLHFAAEACDFDSTRVLLAFGANVNVLNTYHKTPLDLIEGPHRFLYTQSSNPSFQDSYLIIDTAGNSSRKLQQTYPPLSNEREMDLTTSCVVSKEGWEHTQVYEGIISTEYTPQSDVETLIGLLKASGAKRGRVVEEMRKPLPMPCFLDGPKEAKDGTPEAFTKQQEPVDDRWVTQLPTRYRDLEKAIEQRLANIKVPLVRFPDAAMSLAVQMRELRMYRKGGSRILFLDGGGMKGLLQIEILRQIEEATGRRITELFDWIVGTSTGGIIALALVYAKKTPRELCQLFFQMKDDIFGNPRAGMAYNTDALEEKLREVFHIEGISMNDVEYPRVMIAAVNKKTINLKLHFFNNCFHDEFSTQLVWKVARYTSAAPMFFNESDDYVDGGVLANNPCDAGLTKIQEYYRTRGMKLPISMVVSIGSGKYPEKELGSIDARDFLFFGMHWLHFKDTLKDRADNLLTLLSNALVESEMVAENCRSRCIEQGIHYYRFSPQLEEVVAAGETDINILLNTILQTRMQIPRQSDFSEMILRFHQCADASRKMHCRFRNL